MSTRTEIPPLLYMWGFAGLALVVLADRFKEDSDAESDYPTLPHHPDEKKYRGERYIVDAVPGAWGNDQYGIFDLDSDSFTQNLLPGVDDVFMDATFAQRMADKMNKAESER